MVAVFRPVTVAFATSLRWASEIAVPVGGTLFIKGNPEAAASGPELAQPVDSIAEMSLQRPTLVIGRRNSTTEMFADRANELGHGLQEFVGPAEDEKNKLESEFKNAVAVAGDKRVIGGQRSDGWEGRAAEIASLEDWFVAQAVDSLYVVGWRLEKGKDPFEGVKDVNPRETPSLDVGGRAGWAAQFYADQFGEGKRPASECKLYFYNAGGAAHARSGDHTAGKWLQWNVVRDPPSWEELEGNPPQPEGRYGAIGEAMLRAEAIKYLFIAESILAGNLAPLQRTNVPALLTKPFVGASEVFADRAIQMEHGLHAFAIPGDGGHEGSVKDFFETKYGRPDLQASVRHLTLEQLDSVKVSDAWNKAGESRVLVREKTEHWSVRAQKMASKSDWFISQSVDSLYVVGWRLEKGKDQFTGRNDVSPRETPILDIGGGTGWAAQFYIDRFQDGGEDPANCKLYFYDDGGPAWARKDPNTDGRWNLWNATAKTWEPMDTNPPKPTGVYGGIGSTRLSERAEQAIKELFIQK